MTTKEKKKKSSDSPPTSFSSLPYDIILNCLARVSIFHRPTLSLVSKYFRSLIASPDLEATRSCIGITEEYLCVYLVLKNNLNPHWFAVSPIPKQKLKSIPSFNTYIHYEYSTVVSSGSKIYITGGFLNRTRSKRVLILDCVSHQCRKLPNMRQPRANAAVDVSNGKIYVTGGCESNNNEDCGEVYDPKTNTWEPICLHWILLSGRYMFAFCSCHTLSIDDPCDFI
ncbi:putative F-box/kelch-repeat protein [Cardamine amara subsp. amara]|uniref:F-box/kelch-repeat protein n=1 Tax=Cardamine amara subsp. amara TaxID=228776 RepID=A0ABD0Z966_CARAN